MGTFEGQLVGWLPSDAVAAREIEAKTVIAALVNQYSATLYRVAYSVTRNTAEAEDVVQETFLRVLRHQDKLAEVRDFRIWLVRIAWNLVMDHKRRAKVRPEMQQIEGFEPVLQDNGLRADVAAISKQQKDLILATIGELPAKEREVLLLSAVEELSTSEIAAVLKTTESTIRSRIFRGRHALATLLEKQAVSR